MTTQFHDNILSADALDQLFNEARTYNGWHDKDVSEAQIQKIYDLLKMAPTSANMQPVRLVWVRSEEEKAKLAEMASDGNKDKIRAAPVTVIIGYDIDFHEELPWLFPHADAKSWFEGDEEGRKEGAARNSALQGAYLIMAARAIGLDCGPMSGIDLDEVTDEYFGDDPKVKADWVCSIGYGDPSTIFDRSPRPDFEKFNRVV
ncbi:malonic semialdehyde reductase [Pontixanthobacter aestiaquae]|uniref:Malonic semialdehyde reductase n=1 Tax=Pontixanthobacter aestiaquae TaxID=1509367 RepID=A0A844ZE25_9SPHN|nr:malonic semialdehyde reductase [Pontixanthobacter aestiaquae]MDN3644970.1 malonic semialdehyde reductase [Pontixanthobacter aestiaquae]MXO84029.1 malonic semialdehyde reductase [Pontixanthobacter aestiaquae]